jgi:glycosyltransferase involved in cell wall biosynthesis
MLISAKDMLRAAYRGAIGAETLAALGFRARDGKVAVFYAGARAGEFGGTLVKVRLLKSRFPEHRIGLSLLYVLSNAIYVPQVVLDRVRAAGVPVVLNQNGVFYPGWYPDEWQRANVRMAKVHAVADHVFYQSEFCRRCAERFLGARSGPSEILYNAVDTSHFTPREDAPRRGHFTFLLTGKIGPSTAYRLTSSIAGLAAARAGGLDVRLRVAGVIDAKLEAAARAQIERLNSSDAVTFSGPYTGEQAPQVYRSADAYLMTKHNDPCPNAVLEAMAAALPVLYTASGGVPEQVGPEAGVGLPVPDTFERDVTPEPQAIAEGMARIMRGREAMAAAARARAVEHFCLSRWFARHEEVFRALVKKAA